MPFASQQRMVQKAEIEDTVVFESGHSPYLSKTEEVAEWIVGVLGRS